MNDDGENTVLSLHSGVLENSEVPTPTVSLLLLVRVDVSFLFFVPHEWVSRASPELILSIPST
jgi:hypothetical protein